MLYSQFTEKIDLYRTFKILVLIEFDEHGFLSPNAPIKIEPEELREYFVHSFPNSISRRRLFDNYIVYTQKFQKKIYPYFEQWINGSFATKKENPNDIDIVTFLDHGIFELKAESLEAFLSFSLEDEGIDAYIVPEYPEGHRFHPLTLRFRSQWKDRFTSSKADDQDRIWPKGFVTIKFG